MAIEKFSGKFTKEDGGCTIVINETINLIRNSDGLALYTYLSCRPNDWDLNIHQLMAHFTWGENKTYKILKYLQKIQLLKKNEHREKGKFVKHEYLLMLRPIIPLDENHQLDESLINTDSSPLDDLPQLVLATTGEIIRHNKQRDLQNKDKIKSKENKKTEKYQETYFPMPEETEKSNKLSLNELCTKNPFQIPAQMIDDWMTNRKIKKLPITQTVWSRLNKELGKCNNPIDAFEEMVSSGWQGFNAEWVNKSAKKSKSHFDNESTDWANNIDQDVF